MHKVAQKQIVHAYGCTATNCPGTLLNNNKFNINSQLTMNVVAQQQIDHAHGFTTTNCPMHVVAQQQIDNAHGCRTN